MYNEAMNTNIEVLKQDYILKEVIHSLSEAEGIKARLSERHPEYLDSDIVVRKIPTLSSSWQIWINSRCIDRFGKFKKL